MFLLLMGLFKILTTAHEKGHDAYMGIGNFRKGNTMSNLKYKWWDFHKKNPQVYELVEHFTFEVIKRGFKNYSIKSVFERIRWHTDVETTGVKFKLSNNHTAYYARLFMVKNPDYEGFFRTKQTRGDL